MIPIPSTNAEYEGTETTVTVALMVVAQCPNGHYVAYNMPDVEDVAHHSGKACHWAAEHANTCRGAETTAEPGVDHNAAAAA